MCSSTLAWMHTSCTTEHSAARLHGCRAVTTNGGSHVDNVATLALDTTPLADVGLRGLPAAHVPAGPPESLPVYGRRPHR